MKSKLLVSSLPQIFNVAILILMMLPLNLKAQSNYNIQSDKNTSIKVSGKSNVHDWNLTSSTMESHGDFKFDSKNVLSTLSGFTFNVTAKSLKSGKSSLDSRTYKAMKADKFPKIFYKLTSAVITQLDKNRYAAKTNGDLTIAGELRNISMNLIIVVNPNNTLTCTGSEKIKLTDYKIQPPSYMLGAMKVYNDLDIQFSLQYKKSNLLTVK